MRNIYWLESCFSKIKKTNSHFLENQSGIAGVPIFDMTPASSNPIKFFVETFSHFDNNFLPQPKTDTTAQLYCCRKLLINVPYKRTFGAPDLGQTLDV